MMECRFLAPLLQHAVMHLLYMCTPLMERIITSDQSRNLPMSYLGLVLLPTSHRLVGSPPRLGFVVNASRVMHMTLMPMALGCPVRVVPPLSLAHLMESERQAQQPL